MLKERTELRIAFSADDGQTWSAPALVAAGKQVCYPFVFEPRPGTLWVSFVNANRGWNDTGTEIVAVQEKDLVK